MKGQYVYFIKPIGMDGPIKIGCSVLPERRRDSLATWSPFPLEIVARIDGGGELERRFHARFVNQHERQEWFRWSSELAETIASIVAGDFDITTLPRPSRLPRLGGKTGPQKGMKWSDERKEQCRLNREVRAAEARSGLVRDWTESVHLFIADPVKHGVTREERDRRTAIRLAKHHRDHAAAYLEKAETCVREVQADNASLSSARRWAA